MEGEGRKWTLKACSKFLVSNIYTIPPPAFIPAILSKQKSLNWHPLDVFSSFLTKFYFCGHSLFVDQPCPVKICHDAKEEGKGLV